MFNKEAYLKITDQLTAAQVQLVAVSKLKSPDEILAAYREGQRDFGENYVQELSSKQPTLPEDIRWHFIGHLQSNKVKYIAPFVYLIQGVDSEKLLKEINKQALKNNRIIKCLIQVHIATEETKFGFSEDEMMQIDYRLYPNVEICGLMGMASFSEDIDLVRKEFSTLKALHVKFKSKHPNAEILSMGMSGDYETAIKAGSNMVRIGSLIFGSR